MSKLLPGGGLSGVARLVGTHYEIVSIIYRLLGARVGQRVYWPGSGLDIVEYDLLTVSVGDNNPLPASITYNIHPSYSLTHTDNVSSYLTRTPFTI